LLQAANIDATIVSARSAKPLDVELLKSVITGEPQNKIFTLEEGCMAGGFGAAVLEWAAQERARAPKVKQAEIAVIALDDKFVEHGARSVLLDDYGLSPAKVAQFVIDYVKE
jgi:1-deoxy-D-xylulose-5-phosphate synthase